ncbi:hypothetical protein RND71_036340 [Anisodus tanguticus]|uniref:Integrator complex subunit 3 N-terminal domain-containing protein n=1 Tax=Anisodus tanguticus TaxID=243964 RepID=A0AAE1R1G8_9SOLA|nr:hypothetical protein RND71_036340 [Anisodus tanguticus]
MTTNLTARGTYEAENPIEISLREDFEFLKPQLSPPFPLTVLLTQEEYFNLNKALIFGILTQPHLVKLHIKHLHAIITDGYKSFTCILVNIVNELYAKLIDSVKIQLIWVTKEMVDVLAIGFDELLVALLRQCLNGDFSEGNLWLCLEMVTLFLTFWDCLLDEEPLVLTKALYVFLRLLADHCRVSSNVVIYALKRMEVEFCVLLLRERFSLCLNIGRDLIRLLQDLVHVPEFKGILKDFLLNPKQFRADGFGDISQVYRTKTPNIVPRWAVIGWLLKSCKKSYVEANLKLALFYDWLFFDENTDNVMNIEPAILLMVNSIPKYMEVTHTLLEFLLIVVDNYDIERKDIIIKGVSRALSTLVKKGVIGSLDVLIRCDIISKILREMLGKLVIGHVG